MRIVVAALIAVAACKHGRGQVPEGISGLAVSAVDNAFLELRFRVRVKTAAPLGVGIDASCQVGVDRIVDLGEPVGTPLEPDAPQALQASPFVTHPLPARPSMCDFEFHAGAVDTGPVIGRACWSSGAIKEGACAPNPVSDVGVGPTGVTAVVTKVTDLAIEYRATAHKDMPKGAWFVRQTSCPGSRNNDSWHSELQSLRTGESMIGSQKIFALGHPPPGTPCETTLGYATEVHGEVTDIATFCHRDREIVPGECKSR